MKKEIIFKWIEKFSKNKEWLKTFSSAILAGICIAFGGIAYLKVGGLAGAILFTFGLLTVVHYKLKLFTGTAGFFENKKDLLNLIVILFGNIVGTSIIALLVNIAMPTLVPIASGILASRMDNTILSAIILGAGCGFVMTTAVTFGREEKFLPLLFGVPLFIMCGFFHSIADAFYYAVAYASLTIGVIPIYASIVIGNFIGCNLYRMIFLTKKYKL